MYAILFLTLIGGEPPQAPPVMTMQAVEPPQAPPVASYERVTSRCPCGCADGAACTCSPGTCPDGRDYASARARSLASGRPLVIFVGQDWYDVPGCICVREDADVLRKLLPYTATAGVLVFRPDGGDFRWDAFPGASTAAEIEALAKAPPPPRAVTQAPVQTFQYAAPAFQAAFALRFTGGGSRGGSC
jgi:hypothetical protein